jgi:GTP cyclohydrolase IA
MSIPVAPSATGFYQGANMEFDDDFDVRELDGVTMDFEAIRKAVLDVIKAVGEDPDREGLINTPDRVSRMYAELLSGYSADPVKIINGALFNVDYDEMVLVRDIEF